MMKSNQLIIPTLLGVMFATTLLFQNCGQLQTTSSSSFSSFSEWFDYSYSEKPVVYAEFYFYREPGSSNQTLQDYTYVGGITPSQDNSSDVSYTITFKNSNGGVVCPTIVGTSKSFEGTCVGVNRVNRVFVDILVNYDGNQYAYQKIY